MRRLLAFGEPLPFIGRHLPNIVMILGHFYIFNGTSLSPSNLSGILCQSFKTFVMKTSIKAVIAECVQVVLMI